MKHQMCTLFLVRHGETRWNAAHIVQGHTDIALNEKGESQANERGESLRHIQFDAAYSSDLIRARRTTELVLLERKLAIVTTEALRERNFGLYEGKPMDSKHKELCELLSKYNSHPIIQEGRVETNEQIVARVFTFLREVSIAHQNQTVLVGTHGGILRQVLIHLGFATEAALPAGSVKNLAYVELESDGVEFSVKEIAGVILTTQS